MSALVWLVGGRGMLGQAVAKRLHACGHRVRVSGREVELADLGAVTGFAAQAKLTHIINCAAFTKVDACETQQALAHAANTLGPRHLALAACKVGAPILHVSTDYVFDGTAVAPYTEEALCAPLGVYGRSKRAGEEGFWAALEAAPGAAATPPSGYVVRTSWLFGHGGPNFVSTMLRLMGERETFGVVADQFGRPTYCDDLAEAMLQLLGLGPDASAPGPCGLYHFANTGPVSWHGFATGILAQAQQLSMPLTCQRIQAIGTRDYPTPAQRPAYSVLCTDKIAQVLGQTPRTWEKALAAYLCEHLDDVAAAARQSAVGREARPQSQTTTP